MKVKAQEKYIHLNMLILVTDSKLVPLSRKEWKNVEISSKAT